MKKTAATRITTKGQVVIPTRIRAELGWTPGTNLLVEASRDSVLLRRRTRAAQSWLDRIAGCVKRGDPVGDLEDEHRREVERDAHRRS